MVTKGGNGVGKGGGRLATDRTASHVCSTKPDCWLLMMTAMLILLLIMLPLEMWMVVMVKLTREKRVGERQKCNLTAFHVFWAPIMTEENDNYG